MVALLLRVVAIQLIYISRDVVVTVVLCLGGLSSDEPPFSMSKSRGHRLLS